jgi:hypothetical protein
MISTKTLSALLILLGSLCLPACQRQPGDDSTSRSNSTHPVIGRLETRDKLITIRAKPDGPRYTVQLKDGRIVAADLPAADVSAKFPELKPLLERGVAQPPAPIADVQYRKESEGVSNRE